MAMEKTLAIIKPDATARNISGKILARIEEEGFTVKAVKKVRLSKADAGCFYAVHKERPFYDSLTTFMSSGPVVVLCLEREGAIAKWRDVMGATNPANAAEGTIRKKYASSIGENAVHGSDSLENAKIEVAYYFSGTELL